MENAGQSFSDAQKFDAFVNKFEEIDDLYNVYLMASFKCRTQYPADSALKTMQNAAIFMANQNETATRKW